MNISVSPCDETGGCVLVMRACSLDHAADAAADAGGRFHQSAAERAKSEDPVQREQRRLVKLINTLCKCQVVSDDRERPAADD